MIPRLQQSTLNFLKVDHGDYVVESALARNPLAGELGLQDGDLIATFKRCRFIIWQNGGMTPLSHAALTLRPKA